MSNKSTSPPSPALADNGKNHGEKKKLNGLCKPWDLSYSYRLSNVESIFSAFFSHVQLAQRHMQTQLHW